MTCLIPGFMGLVGALLVVYSTSLYGVALSPDSTVYLSGARNLLGGQGYIDFFGHPIVLFPPLFPFLLALVGLVWHDLVSVVRYLNAACFGLIVFISVRWVLRGGYPPVLALLGSAAILLSVSLLSVSVYAWTEPLFILLVLIALLQMERFALTDSVTPVLLAGACTALAVLTRYLGFTLVLTGFALLILTRDLPAKRKFKRLVLFGATSMSLPVIWLVRNYSLSGTLSGPRAVSMDTLESIMYGLSDTVTSWLVPTFLPVRYRALLIILLLAALLVVLLKARRKYPEQRETARRCLPFLLFAGVYVVSLLVNVSLVAVDPVGNRFLSPVHLPLLFALITLASSSRAFDPSLLDSGAGVRLARAGARAGLVMCLLVLPVLNVSSSVSSFLADGAGGFHTTRWVSSQLIAHLREHPLSGTVYSNRPYAAYILAGQTFVGAPAGYSGRSRSGGEPLGPDGEAHLIWFNGVSNDTPEQIARGARLEPIVRVDDGTIYRMTSGTSGQ